MAARRPLIAGRRRDLLALGGFVTLTAAVAVVGSLVTRSSVETWYPTLAKPPFTPPNWVFAPAWTMLYVAMALAAWLVWRKGRAGGALALWGVQLALNLLWSILFFGLQLPGIAFAEIVALWGAIAATITAFFLKSAAAGWLLVPYLAWVSYAALLNGSIWLMN